MSDWVRKTMVLAKVDDEEARRRRKTEREEAIAFLGLRQAQKDT